MKEGVSYHHGKDKIQNYNEAAMLPWAIRKAWR